MYKHEDFWQLFWVRNNYQPGLSDDEVAIKSNDHSPLELLFYAHIMYLVNIFLLGFAVSILFSGSKYIM